MTVILNLWHGLIGRRAQPGAATGDRTEPDLKAQVNAAHREWQAAQQYFQAVSEPQLVDHAVHTIIAAERKYMYLLHKVRESRGVAAGQEE